jgi:hypothetical protein
VFTCPGVRIERLSDWEHGPPDDRPSDGFDSELAAVQAELAAVPARVVQDAERGWSRACRRIGMAPTLEALAELRDDLIGLPLEAADDALDLVELPRERDGLEHLPMFFDATHGRVALAGLEQGVELLAIAEEGGVSQHLASYARPRRLPRLEAGARQLLRGYLRHMVERDAFLGSGVFAAVEDPEIPILGHLAADLLDLEVAVLTRGAWRAQLQGRDAGVLDVDQVADGIRATDMEFLDRPTAGRLL